LVCIESNSFAGFPADVLKLISTAIDPDVVKELRLGKGTLEFGDSPFDPFLAQIPVKEVVYSETIIHDFTLLMFTKIT
jgi:hypothetical protein